MMTHCTNCGQHLKENAKYCANCGAAIKILQQNQKDLCSKNRGLF